MKRCFVLLPTKRQVGSRFDQTNYCLISICLSSTRRSYSYETPAYPLLTHQIQSVMIGSVISSNSRSDQSPHVCAIPISAYAQLLLSNPHKLESVKCRQSVSVIRSVNINRSINQSVVPVFMSYCDITIWASPSASLPTNKKREGYALQICLGGRKPICCIKLGDSLRAF